MVDDADRKSMHTLPLQEENVWLRPRHKAPPFFLLPRLHAPEAAVIL